MAEHASWNYSFPSVEKWKEALLALPDGTFLHLIRAYLGPVKTPYNKSRLVEDLQSFLSQDTVQQAVEIYLDPFDWQCVAAILFLGEPELGDLLYFFETEYPLGTLHERLVNLEERLVVFRYSDEGSIRLAVNPLFRSIIEKYLSPAMLFSSWKTKEGSATPGATSQFAGSAVHTLGISPSSSFTAGEGPATQGVKEGPGGKEPVGPVPVFVPWTDLSLGALLVFLWHGEDLFKKDGTFTKKALSQVDRLFPQRDVVREILPLIRACEALGLFSLEEGGLSWNEPALEEFIRLESTSRLSYLIVGLWVRKEEKLSFVERRRRFNYLLQILLSFLQVLSEHRLYSSLDLRKILILVERTLQRTERRWGASPQDPHPLSRRSDELWEYLVWFGFLLARGPDQWQWVKTPPSSDAGRKIHVESAQSIVVFPGISFAEFLSLGRFCRLVGIDQTFRFELNRDDVIKAFDKGWTAAAIKELLQDLCDYPIPENLSYLLGEWERRYHSVMIHQGPVLVLGKDRQYLAETEPLKSYIWRSLAPGVYLLKVRDPVPVQEALKAAGVDIIAQPPHPEAGSVVGSFSSFFKRIPQDKGSSPHSSNRGWHFFPLPSTLPIVPLAKGMEKPLTLEDKKDEVVLLRRGLQKKLAELSLSPEQEEELQNRIERRIILAESQLIPQSVRYERLEARGLDYVGKVRLVEQALSHHSLLEVLCRGPHGEPLKYLGEPKALEKKPNELILILKSHPEGEEKSIPLGKISYIRRIKTSLFEES